MILNVWFSWKISFHVQSIGPHWSDGSSRTSRILCRQGNVVFLLSVFLLVRLSMIDDFITQQTLQKEGPQAARLGSVRGFEDGIQNEEQPDNRFVDDYVQPPKKAPHHRNKNGRKHHRRNKHHHSTTEDPTLYVEWTLILPSTCIRHIGRNILEWKWHQITITQVSIQVCKFVFRSVIIIFLFS